MISIVICSVNEEYLAAVTENISRTIGVGYELLVWDNRADQKGLCEVYNLMAARAIHSCLCFIHEDIIFHNEGWGRRLVDLFERRPGAGVVGVAGGKYKSRMYSGWYAGQNDLDFMNITHRVNGKDELIRYPATGGEPEYRVVAVDGVLIACTRKAWEEIRFDQQLLPGFHFYDVDFSLRASERYEIWVTMEIALTHITKGGDYGDRWVKEAIRFHEHFRNRLPRVEGSVQGLKELEGLETRVAKRWLDWLKAHRISLNYKRKWIMGQQLYKWPSLWYRIFVFLVYEPFGLRRLHSRARKRNYKAS